MIVVGPGPCCHVEHAAAGPAHVRVVGVQLNFDFFDRLDGRVQHRPPLQLRDRHSVQQIVIRADAAATERDARRIGLVLLPVELGVTDGHHRRDGDPDQERIPPRRGQRFERLPVQHGPCRRGRRVDERRLAGHGDVFLDASDLECDVQRDELLRADVEPLRLERLVSGDLRLQRVGTRRDRRKIELPHIVGDRFTRDVRRLVGQRDRHAGNHAVGVLYRSAYASCELLGVGRCCNRQHEQRADHDAGESSQHIQSSG